MTVDKCADHDVTAAAGRVDDLGGDVWDSWLVLVNGALSSSPLDGLLTLVGAHPARTGTAVVMVADTEPIRGLGVRLTGHGRVLIPSLGLDLIANGLTPAEAQGCALLLAHADLLDDIEMPSDGDDGWREHVVAAGAIRDELVLPRGTDPDAEPGATVIPAPDAEVLEVAATTTDDLQQLAPHVPDKVRAAVEGADPGLDADLAAWAAGTRPHLRLLGPIQARAGTTGKPTAVAKRRAFYTELLAFLALHPQGVTIDQVVDAFGSDATQMRVHLSKVRSWLGVDPTTGGNYLPDAKSPRRASPVEWVSTSWSACCPTSTCSVGSGLADKRAAPRASATSRRRLGWSRESPSRANEGAAGLGWPTVSASISTWCALWLTSPTRSPSRPSMQGTSRWPAPLPRPRFSPLLTRTPLDWTSRPWLPPRVTGRAPNASFATT